MARKDEKPMMPIATEPAFTPCASSGCRFPGRLWLKSLRVSERVCINHYYRALDENPDLKDSPEIPPHPKMAGVTAKPVAGD